MDERECIEHMSVKAELKTILRGIFFFSFFCDGRCRVLNFKFIPEKLEHGGIL